MSKKLSKNKLAFEVPKEILELTEGFRKQRVAKELADKLEKQKRDAEEKRVRADRLKKGWKIATKVFLWAEALRESDLGQELMKNARSNLIFFDSHIIGLQWVGLAIAPNGIFLVQSSRSPKRDYIYSPKDLARLIPTAALKMVNEWIDNGQVWDCIKRRLNHLKK